MHKNRIERTEGFEKEQRFVSLGEVAYFPERPVAGDVTVSNVY